MKIHPTAIVHPEAQIDSSVEIGPWCTVGRDVKIGKGSRLMSHIVLEGWTEIGEDNVFFPFSVIGGVPQDLKYKGERTKLEIGNRNTIRESVTMNLGTVQGGGITRLGDDNLVMAYSHLGHDCLVGNGTVIANAAALAGHVIIEDHAIIGGMVAISQYVRCGTHCYVGGHSGLERDIPPYVIAMGTRPSVIKGANIVGLKRKGFSTERIHQITEAIKMWIRPDIQKEPCLAEIEAKFPGVEEVQHFVSFIRKTETGVAR